MMRTGAGVRSAGSLVETLFIRLLYRTSHGGNGDSDDEMDYDEEMMME